MSKATSHAKVEMGSERGFGIVFAVVFALIVMTQGSAVAPFIYTLF